MIIKKVREFITRNKTSEKKILDNKNDDKREAKQALCLVCAYCIMSFFILEEDLAGKKIADIKQPSAISEKTHFV